jgi:type II secretory pathway pseudopilin PulG
MSGLHRLARDAEGFGLVELLIALMVLNVGIFAVMSAFNSGALALRRASTVATASTLADEQMELYRSLTYPNIVLVAPTTPDAAYTSDSQYGGQVPPAAACPAGIPPGACQPIQTVSGPDHRQYRIDTYLHQNAQSTGPYNVRPVKVVAVVVRDAALPSLPALLRTSSTFDQSTGT